MTRFVTFGETLAQYNAAYIGPFDENGDYVLDCAGAESNVAVDLQKLGLPNVETLWVSRVGDDEAGNFVLRELDGRTRVAAKSYKGEATGVSYLNHHADDQHIKTYQRKGSAASRLKFQDVQPYLDDADVLHVTGITPALSDSCRRTIFESLNYAVSRDIPVSFDLNYREQLWNPDEARSVYDEILPYSSVFKLGHDEAEVIWAKGWSTEEYAKHFQKSNGRIAVVTRGNDGAMAFDGTNLVDHSGYEITMLDPVGAGDAFVAGFLAGILQKFTIKEFLSLNGEQRKPILRKSLEIANVCGALTCTRRGDTAAMPTMEEVREFIRVQG